jgi:hypothetical protein
MNKVLQPLKFKPFRLGEVKPTRWLKNQLTTQLNGLSGHLDEFWPDVMDSGWIGGKAEGWERFPYWLDGVIPLAFLLESDELIKRIEGYINYILDHQQEDGWFGPSKWGKESGFQPIPDYDPWPNMVFCKALIQYFEVTEDMRIISALLSYYLKLDKVLDEHPMGIGWAQMRWMDGVWGIHWLIDYLKKDNQENTFLFSLAKKLQIQGYDWKDHFDNFYYIYFLKKFKKGKRVIPIVYSDDVISNENKPKQKLRKLDLRAHVVNNVMGIKSSTLWSRQSCNESDKQAILTAISNLEMYHGQVTGVTSGDEYLVGKNPSQGTELCSVVEYMFSLEISIPILGQNPESVLLIDRLEKICFNALPATFLPNMWAHQYDQQVNQVQAKLVKEPIYSTNGKDSNIYGLEPSYGCCTANMHQGWPKFIEYGLWAKDDDGIVCLAYSPCKISTSIKINDKMEEIEIEEQTNYPFSDSIEFFIRLNDSRNFSWKFRIPKWTFDATIQINQETPIKCKPGNFCTINREWKNNDKVKLILPMNIQFETRYNKALAILRGPLVFSYNPEEEHREMKEGSSVALLREDSSLNIPSQVKDWEVLPKNPWQYALIEPLTTEINILKENIDSFQCFNNQNPPLKLKVKAVELSNWEFEFEAAKPPPINPEPLTGNIEEIELIPYGCSNIRITEFPVVKQNFK